LSDFLFGILMTSRYVTLSHKPIFRFSALSLMLLQAQYLFANENSTQTAVMPTIKIEAMSELDPIKSYIDYEQASVTRNGLKKKDIPCAIGLRNLFLQEYRFLRTFSPIEFYFA